MADLDAAEYDDARIGLWTRGLLIRRNIADGDLAFFSTLCPAGTGIEMLVNPAHCRQARATTHPACQHYRKVTLATGSSSLSSESAFDQKNATVMLVDWR